MKKQGKRLVTLILILGLLMQSVVSLGNPGTASRAAETEQGAKQGDKIVFNGKNFEVVFEITSKWSTAYNANVTIKNTSDATIHNWSLLYYSEDTITNIWNGKEIKSDDYDITMIKNAEWNQDIQPESTVSYGFTAEYKDIIYLPTSFAISTSKKKVDDKDYKVEFVKDSDWKTGYTARMIITNTSETKIEDWELSFDFPYTIDSIWGAEEKETEDNFYYLKNPGWNQNIQKGQNVSFGFGGAPGDVIQEPKNYTLYRHTTEIDLTLDSDEDGLTDMDELLLGTNAYSEDTDGDGLTDYMEYYYLGLDPLKKDSDNNGVLDGDEDTDEDGLGNVKELNLKLEPWNEDTDYDELLDGEEINKYSTKPLVEDTDGDTLLDGVEIRLGLNPLKKDSDGDGITDENEMIQQTKTEQINEEDANDGAITEVEVNMQVTGDMEDNTEIENMYGIDVHSSEVVGLVGVPVEITTEGKFEQATITFHYDEEKLGDTTEDNLAIMWYDEENDMYEIYDEESVIDKSKNTISYTTTHFSKYLVVKKSKWYNVWKREINYRKSVNGKEFADFVFTIDASKSMKGQELENTKTALKAFAKAKRTHDRGCIIRFSKEIEVLTSLTKKGNKIIEGIGEVEASYGGGAVKGLKRALKQYTKDNYKDIGNRKTIIFITDGNVTYEEDIVETAKENDITIFTIMIGNEDATAAKQIALDTGGICLYAKSASDIGEQIFWLQNAVYGELDTKDSDKDGLYDVYEREGMLLSNGTVIKTAKEIKQKDDKVTYEYLTDTDEDDLKDGEEIKLSAKKMELLFKNEDDYIEASYFIKISNPKKADTDGDEYIDSKDRQPNKRNVILYGIKDDRNFVPIEKNSKEPVTRENWNSWNTAYGGDQGWWAKATDSNQKEIWIRECGYGVIACANIIMYENGRGKIRNVLINKQMYMQLASYAADIISPFKFKNVGTFGYQLNGFLEKFKNDTSYKYETKVVISPFKNKKRQETIKTIKEQLKNKNAFILGISAPAKKEFTEEELKAKTIDRDKKIKMYSQNKNSLINFDIHREKMYKHYVVVTGILYNNINKNSTKIYLQVSSWGQKIYIEYNDIYDYLDRYSSAEAGTDIIYIE